MSKYVLVRKNEPDKFFVDGFYEPVDWTWGNLEEATVFDDFEFLQKRLDKTPFGVGSIPSSEMTILEIN